MRPIRRGGGGGGVGAGARIGAAPTAGQILSAGDGGENSPGTRSFAQRRPSRRVEFLFFLLRRRRARVSLLQPRTLPSKRWKRLKLRRVHFTRIQARVSAGPATPATGASAGAVIDSSGVDNGAEVEELGAGGGGVSGFPATTAAAGGGCAGGFTGEEANAAVRSEGFVIGRAGRPPPAAAVDDGRDGGDGGGEDDGGDGSGNEFWGGVFGGWRVGKDKGGDVGGEGGEGRGRRWWRW